MIPWRERPAIRTHELADLLGVSRSTVTRIAERHNLKPNRQLGVPLFAVSDVLRLLREVGLEQGEPVTKAPATRAELAELRRFTGGR